MQIQTQFDFTAGAAAPAIPGRPSNRPEPLAAVGDAGGRVCADAPLSAADASARLERIIEDAFQAALAWTPDPEAHGAPAPGVGVAASAGVGKTEQVLEGLVRHGRMLLQRGHVLFQFPTLELAQQACERFLAKRSGLPALVLRGRLAADPENPGQRMCVRADAVEPAQRYLASVGQGFCRTEKPNGTIITAPCFATCRYFAQFASIPYSIIFTSHGYLSVPVPASGPVSLRIIDESFWQSLCRISRAGLDIWLAGPKPPARRPALRLIDQARRAVYDARRDGSPVCAALRALGVELDHLTAFADFEMERVASLELTPDLSDAERTRRLAAFDAGAWNNARRRAGIWRLLAEVLHLEDTERLAFDAAARCPRSGEQRPTLTRHVLHPLALDAPTIVIDADLDPSILSACLPGLAIHKVVVDPQAEIVQLVDRTLSNAFLLDHAQAHRHRERVLDVIEDEVRRADGGGVLVVAARKVLKVLHDDARTPGRTEPTGLLKPLRGATPRWFGANLRGVDTFRDYATAVIVGRLEQAPRTIVDLARCLFGDSGAPLDIFGGPPGETEDADGEDEDHGAASSCFEQRPILRSGAARPRHVRTRTHRDPRCRAVESQLREAATSQAIARLRLIHPSRPKRVVILSSLPIPGLPVTQLLTWRLLRHPRLRAAFEEAGWRGLRLSAGGLSQDAPSAFGSPKAAESWIRRLGGMAALRAAVAEVASCTRLSFCRIRLTGGRGHLSPAVLCCDPADGELRARVLWPHLSHYVEEEVGGEDLPVCWDSGS